MSEQEINTPEVATEPAAEAAETVSAEPAVETPDVETPSADTGPQTADIEPSVDSTDTISDWRGNLSADLQDVKSLKDYKDVEALARSHVHLQALMGKKVEDLSPEEAQQLAVLRGAPSSPEEYSLPEDADPNLAGWFVKEAHAEGLTQEQARHLSEKYMEVEQMMKEEYDQNISKTRDEWLAEVKEEFGSAFKERVQVAQKAVQTYGGAELKDYLNQTGLGDHPAMVRAFAQIGKELAEDSFTASEASRRLGLTPGEALETIKAKKADRTFMDQYKNRRDPGHKHAVAEMQKLFEVAYPDKS